MLLENEYIRVELGEGPLPCVRAVANHLSGKSVTFGENHISLLLGKEAPVVISSRQADKVKVTACEKDRLALTAAACYEGYALELALTYRLEGPCLSMELEIANAGENAAFIKDVIFFEAYTSAEAEGQESKIDLSLGEAHFMQAETYGRVDAWPIFLDGHLFCGIDWPVAENAVLGKRLLCRQFTGRKLEPGERMRARTLTIGAGKEGGAARAFLDHLEAMRGRKTRRASMYFTWLTHAWEGLEEKDFDAHIKTFEKLKEAYGLSFDIVLADAGVVETLHGMYHSKYRLRYDRLTPGGVKQFADRLKDIGTDFGVWLGPDGFGEREEDFEKRLETVTGMVRDWNVALIKFDCAVSSPLGPDRYRNERYMNKLERLMAECRKIRPDFMVINHRITSSPYILGILDSTLWEGMETYPDVYLVNTDKPRLFTRFASYSRGEPVYCGVYSYLLEDHGVCFNGEWQGWAEELVVQTFGRALMLSPEAYGTLFLLPDSEYPRLARLMQLVKDNRDLFVHTHYHRETVDFIHSDGERALICMINDSWEKAVRLVNPSRIDGLEKKADAYRVIMHFPEAGPREEDSRQATVPWEGSLEVKLHPFAAAVVEVSPEGGAVRGALKDTGAISTLPEAIMEKASCPIGKLSGSAPEEEDVKTAERIKFMVSNDPTEAQVIKKLPPSVHPEINQSRRLFLEKIKKCHVFAECAWDDNPATAWGDYFHWDKLSNIWRVDLGDLYRVARVEVTLADLGPGPVVGEETGRKLGESVLFEVSPDCGKWYPADAQVFHDRIINRKITGALIADFGELPEPVRYIRMHVRGILVGDIRVKELKEGRLVEVPREKWHGNNLLTARTPLKLFKKSINIGETWKGRYLAVTACLPKEAQVPLMQEVAVAWLEDRAGHVRPMLEASPVFPFNGWENNTYRQGYAWTFRTPVPENMTGRELTLKLAWYGPCYGADTEQAKAFPEVEGRLVTVHEP